MAAVVSNMKAILQVAWDSELGSWTRSIQAESPSDSEYVLLHIVRGARLMTGNIDELVATGTCGFIANESAAFARDNACCVVRYHPEGDTIVCLSSDELDRLCRWWIAIEDSPDFTNPDAQFEPIEIEYNLNIPDDLNPDFVFAVYVAEAWCKSGEWKRAKKIDDLNAVYVWEPDGKQRSMIVSYDEIEQDVAYEDRFVLGSKGTTFEELHAAYTAGIRTNPADL